VCVQECVKVCIGVCARAVRMCFCHPHLKVLRNAREILSLYPSYSLDPSR